MMKTDITRTQTPEERELSRKLSELFELELELAERELDIATLQAELRAFEARYFRIVGVCYAELDEIEAQISEAKVRIKPNDKKIKEKAAHARAQAQATAQAAGMVKETIDVKFAPSESIKRLYREVAKCIHPDLSTDEKDRTRRNELMADANRAYKDGDEAKILEILTEWESCPESVIGEGIAAELIRVIRKIEQVKKRLGLIGEEIARLKKSELYELKIQFETGENEGRDLLLEMASRVKEKIAIASERLSQIVKTRVPT